MVGGGHSDAITWFPRRSRFLLEATAQPFCLFVPSLSHANPANEGVGAAHRPSVPTTSHCSQLTTCISHTEAPAG